MEISMQSDRPLKKLTTKQILESKQVKLIDPQEERQKQRYIKKLTIKNRELLEELKHQNQLLTIKISKQKAKPRSNQKQINKTKGFQSVKRQLANAYKQIDMYKMVLANLRAKDLSSQAYDKLSNIQGKIKLEDMQIQQLQKQLKILNGIKGLQQKDIKVFENQDIKNNIQQLQNQISNLKERQKAYRKSDSKRQQAYKKQQAYQLQLERLYRQYNQQYYPGQQIKKKQQKRSNQQIDINKITQQQWQIMKNQLKSVRLVHQELVKKIQYINKQKIKQIKSNQQNELKLKEKQKICKNLMTKVSQLKKLLIIKKRYPNALNGLSQQNQSSLMDINTQRRNRQFKKWIIPEANVIEKGKIYPNSIFFSDKKLLQSSIKIRIIQVQIWLNLQNEPCVIRTTYINQKQEIIKGNLPNLQININTLDSVNLQMQGGDYLIQIQGIMNQASNIIFLMFKSRFGKITECGKKNSNGTKFNLNGKSDEIPSCIYGAFLPKTSNGYNLCHLGCQFSKDW